MFIYNLIYWVVFILLFIHTILKFKNSKNLNYLFITLIQAVALVAQIICAIANIKLDVVMQIYILIFGFIVPSLVFFADVQGMDLNELVNVKLGDFYTNKRRYLKAITCYKNALTYNNQNSAIYAKLGKVYKLNGDRRTAFDRFAKALELNKDDYMSYYEVGSIFNDMGKFEDARVVLDNSLRIKPDYIPASLLLADVLSSLGKTDEALNVYKDAIKYDRDNYELYYYMGVLNSENSNFEDAEDCYKRAIEINPTMYLAYFGLGQNYLLNNDLDNAEKMFRKAIPGSETMAKSYFQIAKINMLKGDEEKATQAIMSCIEVDSSYKDKALEEPMFAKIREYIIGISTASKLSQKGISVEISQDKIKKVTSKRAFDVDGEDDNSALERIKDFKIEDHDEIRDAIKDEEKIEEAPLEEIPSEETPEVQEVEEPKEEVTEDVVKSNEDIASYNNILHKSEDDSINVDLDALLDQDSIEFEDDSKKKKSHKVLDFFKTVLGFNRNYYDEDEEESGEADEKATSSVRIIDDDKEELTREEIKEEAKNEEQLKAEAWKEETYQEEYLKEKLGKDNYKHELNLDYKGEEKPVEEPKQAFKASFSEDDLNIYEQFKKLKEDEERKLERLKEEENNRRIKELKEKERIREVEKNRQNRVRFITKEEESKSTSSKVRVVGSFDFDKGGYTNATSSSIVGETDYEIGSDEKVISVNPKPVYKEEPQREPAPLKETASSIDINIDDDSPTGFDFMDRFKK